MIRTCLWALVIVLVPLALSTTLAIMTRVPSSNRLGYLAYLHQGVRNYAFEGHCYWSSLSSGLYSLKISEQFHHPGRLPHVSDMDSKG